MSGLRVKGADLISGSESLPGLSVSQSLHVCDPHFSSTKDPPRLSMFPSMVLDGKVLASA
jgi:hypothetical protein